MYIYVNNIAFFLHQEGFSYADIKVWWYAEDHSLSILDCQSNLEDPCLGYTDNEFDFPINSYHGVYAYEAIWPVPRAIYIITDRNLK